MSLFFKVIWYSLVGGIIGAILFFIGGMLLERSGGETKQAYNNNKKQYEDVFVTNKDISGKLTSYATMIGLVLGLGLGIYAALEKKTPKNPSDKPPKTDSPAEQTKKRPFIP